MYIEMKGMKNAVKAQKVSKYYGQVAAISNISFNVMKGEIFGLLGPNGAGKTTLINIIAGIIPPSSGDVEILGYSLKENLLKVKSLIGFCPQESVAYDFLSALENLLFYAGLYGIPKREAKRRAMELLDLVGLRDNAKKKVGKYSGGMKKRLNLAIALINDPQVILLDEPTTGLDPQIRRMMWDKIRELKKERKTILMATHYMEEADTLSERVAIMDKGKIIALGRPEDLKGELGEYSSIELEVKEVVKGLDEKLSKFSERGKIIVTGENRLRLYVKDPDLVLPHVVETAVNLGAKVLAVHISEPTLEDLFIKLTGRRIEEG